MLCGNYEDPCFTSLTFILDIEKLLETSNKYLTDPLCHPFLLPIPTLLVLTAQPSLRSYFIWAVVFLLYVLSMLPRDLQFLSIFYLFFLRPPIFIWLPEHLF